MISKLFGLDLRPRRFGIADVVVLGFLLALLYVLSRVGHGFTGRLQIGAEHLNLSPSMLPLYAIYSLVRMFVAFLLSLVFSIVYGYVAAYHERARRILIPLLDILQSVPVLGFLPVAVTVFVGLFPGSAMGLEAASIFAVFTAQAWNMTFAFYHSLLALPRDLREASEVYRLGVWQRLTRLELPAAAISLVWNSMMSFGGSWFFLAASEAVTVYGHTVLLPGLGSYLALASARGNGTDMRWAILAMIVVIVAIDQLFWRPLVAWSQKFKMESTAAQEVSGSFILTLLRRSYLVQSFVRQFWRPLVQRLDLWLKPHGRTRRHRDLWAQVVFWSVGGLFALFTAGYIDRGVMLMIHDGWPFLGHLGLLGLDTMARVFAAVALGALWAVPVGVAIGLRPQVTRVVQPIAQIASSYPANMLFPFVMVLYLRLGISLNIGAIPLMMLGTQWYILFNAIAGAMSIPADLREAAHVFKLRGFLRWRHLILPALFPSLVTGGITAAGGAWNASIVAEIVTWGGHTMVASGLGSFITEAHSARQLVPAVVVMAILVVLVNRVLWRPLYHLAATKYHLD